jgi:ATP-binding cassette, subfamily F, member 3
MIQLSNITKSFGSTVLLDEVSLRVDTNNRIGLIGRNGSGKSTIFRIILGEEGHDSGDLMIPKGYRVGALNQHIHFTCDTVLQECCQELKGEEQYDYFKAERILFGLGFSEEDLNTSPHNFSGGQQIRISLTKALLKNPDLLLLDEPTNYLDILSIRWLKGFLKSFKGEVIIITHDRTFLDDVCTHIVGINRRKLRKIKGDTSKYYQQIWQDDQLYEQTRANQDRKRSEMEAFVERFRAKATKARQAQSRVKQIEKLDSMDKLESEATLSFKFNYQPIEAKNLMEAQNLNYQWSEGPTLFNKLDLYLNHHDRLAIVGKNGSGKSTLLNLLAGELPPQSGSIRQHDAVSQGHFGQTNIVRLDPALTIEEEIQSSNPALSRTAVRAIAGTMMFSGDLAEKQIKILSGGERARVMLGKILAQPSNLLLLDEPTNHLDMESIQSLIDAIDRFPGAVIIITHDEMLLRHLATKLVIFQDNSATLFDGNYDEFLEKVGWHDELVNEQPAKKDEGRLTHKQRKEQRAVLIKERAKILKPLATMIEQLEQEIMDAEERLESLNRQLEEVTKNSEATDKTQMVELSRQIGQTHILIHTAFEQLEPISLEHDQKKVEFDQKLEQLSN